VRYRRPDETDSHTRVPRAACGATQHSIELHDLDAEVTGEAVAVLDEAGAEQRFLDLAQSIHPDLMVLFTGGHPEVAYLTPFEGGAPEVEPVFHGTWLAGDSTGRVGYSQEASLSLSDPDAPLIPYVVPE